MMGPGTHKHFLKQPSVPSLLQEPKIGPSRQSVAAPRRSTQGSRRTSATHLSQKQAVASTLPTMPDAYVSSWRVSGICSPRHIEALRWQFCTAMAPPLLKSSVFTMLTMSKSSLYFSVLLYIACRSARQHNLTMGQMLALTCLTPQPKWSLGSGFIRELLYIPQGTVTKLSLYIHPEIMEFLFQATRERSTISRNFRVESIELGYKSDLCGVKIRQQA